MRKPQDAYIDGDIILHRACAMCQSDFDGEVMVDVRQAVKVYDDILNRWLKDLGRIGDYQLCLTVGKNFRYGLYPDYKGQRKSIVPHPSFGELKHHIMERLGVVWELGIEADDLIGIRITEAPGRIAVSADKDFATLPGRVNVPGSHGKPTHWHERDEAKANMYWFRQAIQGDTVDNFKGIPKAGPVAAALIIPGPGNADDLWLKTLAAFKAKGLTEEYALTMVRLARILRHGDYNFETKEVNLWTPKTTSVSVTPPITPA